MRWIAAWTITVLVLCTVISCTGLAAELGHARQTQTPPCHQHQKAPQKPGSPQTANSCDHQQAVTTDNMAVPAPAAAWLPPESAASPLAPASHFSISPVIFEGPPGPPAPSSVLRI